ncbi:hypothetical protein PENTCL1PPCAC_19862, partial [Pristionchus entomophagus]
PLDREANLRLARDFATEIVNEHKHGLSLLDDILMRLAQVTVDAIDCCGRREPFHSDSLERLSDDALSYVINDNEFKLAKFAYAFTILLREISIIVSDQIKTLPEEVPASTIDIKLECEDTVKQEPVDTAFPLFQEYSDEVMKEENLEESIDNKEEDPGPSVSNRIPKRDSKTDPVSSQVQVQIFFKSDKLQIMSSNIGINDVLVYKTHHWMHSRSEWLQKELQSNMARFRKLKKLQPIKEFSEEVVKSHKQRESIENMNDEPGASVSNRDFKTDSASSQDQQRAARSEWLQRELHANLSRHRQI